MKNIVMHLAKCLRKIIQELVFLFGVEIASFNVDSLAYFCSLKYPLVVEYLKTIMIPQTHGQVFSFQVKHFLKEDKQHWLYSGS